jgi:isoleucyl-tRNA synthetase
MANDIGAYSFQTIEADIFTFWKKHSIYPKAKAKNKDGKKWYFLDGPPYTSGKIHIGTAWNKSLKDMVLRYKRMTGFNVWDRAGYDMHGLPTENKVQASLNIDAKEGIEAYGVDRFVQQCEEWSLKHMKLMNEQFKQLGVWMDFDNPYMPITQEFIEGEWWLIKKAHEKNRLYEGARPMTWCASCETAVAKHELEYEKIKDLSIYVKFPVEGEEKTYIIIWTTTPWTIPFNLAIMVHPDFHYVKAHVEDETWIIAKDLSQPFIEGVCKKAFSIKEEFPGKKLEGMRYLHPLHKEIPHYEEIRLESKNTHTVVLSNEFVELTSGTGMVHCAPGCGPQDYEVGVRNKLPAFNTVDEAGTFPKSMGVFSGLKAKTDDLAFVKALAGHNVVAAKQKVEHEYPHCWRCHKPIIFKATKQWFFKVEDLKEQMIADNNKITWMPEAAFNAFDSWLHNLRDNSISKQRYWGTPLPIWRCNKCDNYIVLGTVKEIEEKSKQKVEKLHKPWIDKITIPCSCGGTKHRVPDILDVWVDAGCASWNCLDYPNRTDHFDDYFPADFILEGKDQIRGWFNLLMIVSTVTMNKPSFKSVYMHGFVQDALGRKMSKSLGNYILPEEVISKYGADTLRYYMIGGANPAVDINYNFEDMDLKYRNLGVLWNIHKFILEHAANNDLKPKQLAKKTLDLEERYILSLANSTIKEVRMLFETLRLNEVPHAVEKLFLELSRTYIQAIRDKAASGSINEKQAVLDVLYDVFMKILKLFAPVAPFITEQMFLNFKFAFSLTEESVHLFSWPTAEEHVIDQTLEKNMLIAQDTIQSILNAREKLKLGVRWPVKAITVVTTDKDAVHGLEALGDMIKTQANVKEIVLEQSFSEAHITLEANNRAIGQQFKQFSPHVVAYLQKADPKLFMFALDKEGKVCVTLDGQQICLTKEHIVVKMHAPEHLIAGDYKYGQLYIDSSRTPELDYEGYGREIMRRIQELRKTMGLVRKDRVQVHLIVDAALEKGITVWENEMKAKCGITDLVFSVEDLPLKHKAEEEVKGKKIVVYAEQV